MTDEQINKTIAAECGFTMSMGLLPDYCNDLNAIHDAEKQLSLDEEYTYGELLREVSGNVGPRGGHLAPNGWGIFVIANLTARQKAEALLKVFKNREPNEIQN